MEFVITKGSKQLLSYHRPNSCPECGTQTDDFRQCCLQLIILPHFATTFFILSLVIENLFWGTRWNSYRGLFNYLIMLLEEICSPETPYISLKVQFQRSFGKYSIEIFRMLLFADIH